VVFLIPFIYKGGKLIEALIHPLLNAVQEAYNEKAVPATARLMIFLLFEVVVMPVYTYRCESCGIRFEQTQKFSDSPLTRCPECGKKSLRKVYQPVGIVFKGSGFYATDHRSPSGGGKSANHNDEKAESKNESSSSETKSSTESKSDSSGPSPENKS
jgi:putative FmdB family regulatory protein